MSLAEPCATPFCTLERGHVGHCDPTLESLARQLHRCGSCGSSNRYPIPDDTGARCPDPFHNRHAFITGGRVFGKSVALDLAAAEAGLRKQYELFGIPDHVADKALDLAAELARHSPLTAEQAVDRLRLLHL